MPALSAARALQKKPDIKEEVRNSQREIRKGTRGMNARWLCCHCNGLTLSCTHARPDVEREISELKRQEATMIKEIKAAAKAGNQVCVKL